MQIKIHIEQMRFTHSITVLMHLCHSIKIALPNRKNTEHKCSKRNYRWQFDKIFNVPNTAFAVNDQPALIILSYM